MIIDNLRHSQVDPRSITVITPFLDQQILLAQHLKPYGIRQVLTIDKCQGIDCDIVLLSCAKQTPADQGFLLKDLKRLNVALTRAKKLLVIIGTEHYLKEVSPLDRIIQKFINEGWTEELNKFDGQAVSYLPKDSKKY